jgi:hypothetical protein
MQDTASHCQRMRRAYRQPKRIGGGEGIRRWRQTTSLAIGSIALAWGMKGYWQSVARWQSLLSQLHIFPSTAIVAAAAYSSTTSQQKQSSSLLPSSSIRTCRFTTKMSSCSGTNTTSSLVGDMPLIGWGTYMIDKADNVVATALRQALALGYRRIDCAPVYFNEDAIGDALHELLHPTTTTATVTVPPSPPSHETGAVMANDDNDDAPGPPNPLVQLQRSDLYIVSKLPSPFHRHVEMAVRKTLRDLRLDYLDLYLGAYRHMCAAVVTTLLCASRDVHWLPGFCFLTHVPNVFFTHHS